MKKAVKPVDLPSLERPPALEDGEYWIGRFCVEVRGDEITITSRQNWSHNHQKVDRVRVERVSEYVCTLGLERQSSSAEAERRIRAIFASPEWKPRKLKYT